jgi:SHO1 osmosensor
VLYTLASDAIAMHRFQIATFGAVAIVFSVNGVNQGIFSGSASLDAMGAGWFILACVNILWTLFFTAEEDSLMFHFFNSFGTGGLTPPSRRRTRARTSRSLSMSGANGGGTYSGNYATGGIGSNDNFDSKLSPAGMGMGMGGGPPGSMGSAAGGGVRSQNSFNGGQSLNGAGNTNDARSMTGTGTNTGGGGSIHNFPSPGVSGAGLEGNTGPASPLMGGNAGIGSGGGSTTLADSSGQQDPSFTYKAKALYACEYLMVCFCSYHVD